MNDDTIFGYCTSCGIGMTGPKLRCPNCEPRKKGSGGKRPGAGKPAPNGKAKARSVRLNDKQFKHITNTFGGLTAAVGTLLPDKLKAKKDTS